MNSIEANKCLIHFNDSCYAALNQHLSGRNFSKIFILVDENTHEHCLPLFLENLETTEQDDRPDIIIKDGNIKLKNIYFGYNNKLLY